MADSDVESAPNNSPILTIVLLIIGLHNSFTHAILALAILTGDVVSSFLRRIFPTNLLKELDASVNELSERISQVEKDAEEGCTSINQETRKTYHKKLRKVRLEAAKLRERTFRDCRSLHTEAIAFLRGMSIKIWKVMQDVDDIEAQIEIDVASDEQKKYADQSDT